MEKSRRWILRAFPPSPTVSQARSVVLLSAQFQSKLQLLSASVCRGSSIPDCRSNRQCSALNFTLLISDTLEHLRNLFKSRFVGAVGACTAPVCVVLLVGLDVEVHDGY